MYRLRGLIDPQGFNEAEAITPRIRIQEQNLLILLKSFNEAEAITPRILPYWETRMTYYVTLQ